MTQTNIILKENYNTFNSKCDDLLNIYFRENYNILHFNSDTAIQFIINNNFDHINIIFYINNTIDTYELNIMNYIQNNNIYCKIFFILIDWWKIPPPGNYEVQHNFISNIFKATNYKVVTFSYDIYQLSSFYNIDFTPYQHNIIHLNLWSSYNLSFVDFNHSPIQKVLISGRIFQLHYPERTMMLGASRIEFYDYNNGDVQTLNNNYNKILNNYIAAFTSSVYIFNESTQQIENTHMVLLKTFEILGSGALLISPISEELYLQKFGIINGVNCILFDFNNNLDHQIDYILDPNNIEHINSIRYNGYLHSRNNLNSYNKFIELKNLLNL